MDYSKYQWSKKELVQNIILFCMIDGCISYLFFRSWMVFVLGVLLFPVFSKERKAVLCRARKEKLAGQFIFAMQAVTASLTAGYSVETAFEDACRELRSLYAEDELIMKEMNAIVSNLKMNRNLEGLLLDFSNRSGIEEIQSFAELFAVAKRTGGNLIAIIRNTSDSIGKKEETRKEIQATLSAKKMEQNIMSVIPCAILLYVQVMSPGFLDGMYHNLVGIAVMSVCLLLYAIAFFWGRRIVEIEV